MLSSTNTLPQGFIPVMLTPFTDSGAVDYDGLKVLTEYYINAGSAGLFANCLSSEMYELTEEERLAVTSQVVKQAAGVIPVVATGTLGGTIAEQAEFVKKIYATGVQAVIVITSLIAEADESDEVFVERMEELMSLTPGIPLGFYECPVPYKRLISAEILARLLPTGRLIYHKDTCLDAVEVKRRIDAGQGYNFGLYDAYMVNARSSLQAGAAGLSCIQGNIFPELIVWFCKHFNDENRVAEVEKVQQFFNDSMDIVHSAYPTIAKYSLVKRGFPISTYTRRDVGVLTDTLKAGMDDLLVTIDNLQKELGITPAYLNAVALA
ncbi:dihydrodipicolinate synthase family protein [Emticicia sp. TH156]|uniref:dihydrodipicolinate synthase family protein n=1 Tax=Emticicia sp. TH156 TaxID=2067454 RepID=UPI000C7668C2|nr:dihydrodipicolinate synthase family protein [Emticicia sp. TH156]PLK45149.1 dihydrodipicolinate synthase family protein [Emticicia sp. TH156]